jgi:hypothetical protein
LAGVSDGGGGAEKSIAKIAMIQKRLPEMPKLPKIAEIEKQNLRRRSAQMNADGKNLPRRKARL